MLHRTQLYSQRVAECFTEHSCTHREWQSASENTAVLTESDRVLQRTLLYSQRVTECFREHSCTDREWQSASQNTAVLTESDRVLHRTLLYSQRVTECFREHSCTQSGSAFRHTTDFHNHNNKKIYIKCISCGEAALCSRSCVYSFVWLKKEEKQKEKEKEEKKGKKKMVVA